MPQLIFLSDNLDHRSGLDFVSVCARLDNVPPFDCTSRLACCHDHAERSTPPTLCEMSSRPELKIDDEVGFIKVYRQLETDKAEDTVRIFDRSDWYSAHGDDAVLIARVQYKTTSVLKTLGRNDNLPSVTMTHTAYRSFLREAIFRLGKRVEILQSSGRNQWKVAKQASPGNLQDVEDELGGHVDSAPIILAVKISAKATEARTVGVCFADASVRELGVTEFVDNDIYSNFESLLIQLGVKECLLQIDSTKKDPEHKINAKHEFLAYFQLEMCCSNPKTT